MEKLSSSLAVLAEKSRKRLKFGISPRRTFENANLLAEDFPLFSCMRAGGIPLSSNVSINCCQAQAKPQLQLLLA